MKKYLNRKGTVSILLVFAVMLGSLLCFTSCGDSKESKWEMDYKSVVVAVYKPADGANATAEQLSKIQNIIETRMTSLNIKEYDVEINSDTNEITVSYPSENKVSVEEAEKSADNLKSTGYLTFRSGNDHKDTTFDSAGNPVYKTPTGESEEILMDGSMVEKAETTVINAGENAVKLIFTKEGKEKFAEITEKHISEVISIWMDDVMISAPTIQEKITGGEAVISGNFTSEDAAALAEKINAGTLPVKLETVKISVED